MENYFRMYSCVGLLFIFSHFGHTETDKRLLLHSELDIAKEFAKVNRKIDEQILQIQNLSKDISDKDKEIETLKKTVADLQNSKACTGSTYIRWGRTTCPHNTTNLVYNGYMASSAYNTTGGGANVLCLSPDPQWSYYDESVTSHASIKGVEYEFSAFQPGGTAKFFGHDVHNDDAVCAVCHIPRSASLMIPGRTDCYSGWTKEYSGYLVSEFDGGVHESDFICLDDRPEALVGGKNNDNEGVLFFVEASCGKSLECPPYINGRELTCVVCSK